MTKEKAIENHRKMWNWIADRIEKDKQVFDIHEMKIYYMFDMESGIGRDYHYCYCCYYANNNCDICPIKWPSDNLNYPCEDDKCREDNSGLWWQCQALYETCSCDWKKQAKLAREIAKLPEREL